MHSNKIYSISSIYDEDVDRGIRISRCRTRTLAHILKQETDANVVSIELVNYNTNRVSYFDYFSFFQRVQAP